MITRISGVFPASILPEASSLAAAADTIVIADVGPEVVRRLAKSDGNVRLAIEDNVLEL